MTIRQLQSAVLNFEPSNDKSLEKQLEATADGLVFQ